MIRSPRIVPAVLAAVIVSLLASATWTVLDRRSGTQDVVEPGTNTALAELEAFVETARGLRFLEPVDVEVVGDAAFRRLLSVGEPIDEFDEAVEEGVLRALGLFDGADDLGAVAELDPDTVAGFYDTGTKDLVVRGPRLTPFVRQVVVHELTHALDDQHFGLDRDFADEESALAFEALVEGNAVLVESRYLASLSPAERQAAADEEEATFGAGDGGPLPKVVVELAAFPYRDGRNLVEALLAAGGQRRLDAAFRRPPTTSAEVLHPDRFLGGRPVAAAPPVAADGRVVDEGPLGELVLRVVLAQSLPEDQAARAADGWAGDRYVAWRAGRRTCVRAAFVLDTPAEAAELGSALRRWAGRHPGASADGPLPATATVVLTRCA